MKRKFKSICIILLLVLILVFILSYPKDIIDSVLLGINIWMYNVFPSLFPFFILSDLLINYGFIEILCEIFKNHMRIFGLSGNCAFIVFGSLITGSPSSAKITKQLLEEELITVDEANHLIKFTHFSSPLFVIGTVGSVLLNDIKLGYLIFISLILGNFIIGIFFKKKSFLPKEPMSLKKAIGLMHKKRINNKNNFITILSDSIYNAIDILILLLGIIIVFLIISSIISKFSINNNLLMIIKGILEMTQGVKNVSISNFNLLYKVILITFFLSFGGLSIHLQVSSIINGTKIKYKNFLISRIIHSILSSILVFILFYMFG